MARTSTAKADEFNAQQEALRQQAREGDSNVVDLLSIEERIEADNEYRRKLADTLDMHLDMIELAQERIRALKTEAQANGVIWPAMLAMVTSRPTPTMAAAADRGRSRGNPASAPAPARTETHHSSQRGQRRRPSPRTRLRISVATTSTPGDLDRVNRV